MRAQARENQRKVFLAILVLAFISGMVCPLFSEKIVLLHSNDTHGTFKPYKIKLKEGERLIGGMEATSHHINEIKAKEQNILIIETGDLMTGTLAAEIEYRGVAGGAMIEFLNRLGYDVWCYGNHDFDKGQQNAIALSKLAKFPTVMSNIVYKKNGRLFPAEPYHIFTIGSTKVGVIAVMEENFLTEVLKESVEGLDVLPVIPTINSYIPYLDQKTDLIVVVHHGWFNDGVKIARNVPGIDIVLVAAEDGKFEEVNKVLVKSTLGHQRTLGYLKVEVENDSVKEYKEDLVWLWADIDLKPSPSVSALVQKVEESIGTEYAKVIGRAKMNLTGGQYPSRNAQGESQLGNWITDVMRWKTGAEIGLHNTGAIRADIAAGPITKANIFDVSPFHNFLVVFKLNGQQVRDMLEFDVERGWDRLQVSGLRYKYYPKETKPYRKRVSYIEVNGEVLLKSGKLLLPKKVYTVVSNDYLVGHARDKYFGFDLENSKNTGFPLDITLMEWLEKYKILDYRIENRIIEIEKLP